MANSITTETLYLSDSYQTTCSAKVIETGKSGNNSYLILDRTVFYPQGGGQPSDKGIIQGTRGTLTVKSVEYNGGKIKHIGTLRDVISVGEEVKLEIDWKTRLKHMELHTGGHVLDEAVSELYPNLTPTKGMHGIGNKNYIEYTTISKTKLDPEKINQLISKLITQNLPVKTEFVSLEELKRRSNWVPNNLPKGKKLRIVQIGERKVIPDGGTQLKSTSELPEVKVTRIVENDYDSAGVSIQVHYVLTRTHLQSPKISTDPDPQKVLDEYTAISAQFSSEINSVSSLSGLQNLENKYLSKKSGKTTLLLKSLPELSAQEKQKLGPLLNKLKKDQEQKIISKRKEIKTRSSVTIDLTIPAPPQSRGYLHPTTQVINELNEFFRYHGFSVAEGPEIESVEYNFRKLNLPEGHPATDLQDSLFIDEPDILLRTHTSSVEARILSGHKPPLRVVVPGKCFRNETLNATNSAFFFQYQGFVVDENITIQHLKSTLTLFHQFLFGENVKLRFRYKYYPEVSPGMGVDMECQFCGGAGCQVCKYRGWLEVLGSGMIHYNTLRSCGIDPEKYTGFAFGLGLDRLVMSKFGIDDIRKLYGGELVYKEQTKP